MVENSIGKKYCILYNTKRQNPELMHIAVPDRVWSINDLMEEELRDLHFELDYEHKEERWWEQEPLRVLDLSSNSLTVIDDKIRLLTELNNLNVCINNLLCMHTCMILNVQTYSSFNIFLFYHKH